MQFFGLKWSKLKYIQWIQSKKLGIYIINRLFLAKSHFALFYLVNLLHKLLGPTATSVLMIGCYNFEGLIISSRYNFGPMSRLIQQLFDFWVHSNVYAKFTSLDYRAASISYKKSRQYGIWNELSSKQSEYY